MRHILLTWNPGPDDDHQWTPEQWNVQMVEGTSEDYVIEDNWSVANRKNGIAPGDRAWLLRQGEHGRGIVAAGEITSAPYAGRSWDGSGKMIQYVDVTWWDAAPLDRRLDIPELQEEIPEFNWSLVLSSGRDITDHGEALRRLWSGERSQGSVLPPVLQGAGFGTAEQNRKVEKAAVRYVTDGYEAEGYEVTSVEAARCGWDLTVTRGSQETHVEVKGAAGSLVRFFLTSNEHDTALIDPNWLLVVVTGALDAPCWHELDGPTAGMYAEPALYQVEVPSGVFAD